MIREFRIGNHVVAADRPPLFFAEIGAFFGQDLDLARGMLARIFDAAQKVARQPVLLKTEILHDAEICLPGDTVETYASKDGAVRRENYRALIERKVFPLSHYKQLFDMCRNAGFPFVVSVYDFAGADFAAESGAAALKIASSNVVHLPLIRHCAAKGLPLVIDTGRATLAEVDRAVRSARAAGQLDIVVEHSPDGHPARPKAHNLRLLDTYRRAFNLPVGLSDHHVGNEMLFMAVAMGAGVIEKGVHFAPELLDIDASHTTGLDTLATLLVQLHDCWLALGRSERDMSAPIEGVIGTSQRQCLVARRDLPMGAKLDLASVRFAFPCRGIPVENWDTVLGWTVKSPVAAGTPILWSDVAARVE